MEKAILITTANELVNYALNLLRQGNRDELEKLQKNIIPFFQMCIDLNVIHTFQAGDDKFYFLANPKKEIHFSLIGGEHLFDIPIEDEYIKSEPEYFID
jgi:hypothetical protein